MASDDQFGQKSFYREWFRRSFHAALRVAGVDRRSDIMRTVLLWAIACLVLFFIPWSHVPIIGVQVEDLSHEMRLAISAVLAVVVIFIISFVYQIFAQPFKMQNELWQRLTATESLLSEIANVERDKEALSELHKKGVELYQSFVSPDDPNARDRWVSDMEKWVESVRGYIKDRWSVSTLHEFNDPAGRGGFSFPRSDNGLNVVTNKGGYKIADHITGRYSGYLYALDHIIRSNSGDHFGQRRLFNARISGDLSPLAGAARYSASTPSTGGSPDAPKSH